MKNSIFILLIFLSISIFGQQQERKLLQNEASPQEMKRLNKTSAYSYGSHNGGSYSYGYGNSEVFIKTAGQAYFTVEIGNQIISNPYGKFRFFDISSGKNILSIYQNGYLIYRTQISVRSNSRIILEFVYNKLYLIDMYPISGHNDFMFNNVHSINHITSSQIGNNSTIDNLNLTPHNMYNSFEMNPVQFKQFKEMLDKTASFDSEKLEVIDMQVATGAFFNSRQIIEILDMFNFESKKVKAAKKLYENCIDRNNYFLVIDSFSFNSSKRELTNFIKNHQ